RRRRSGRSVVQRAESVRHHLHGPGHRPLRRVRPAGISDVPPRGGPGGNDPGGAGVKLTKTKDVSLPTGVLGLSLAAEGGKLYAACMDGALYECDPDAAKVPPFEARHSSFASGCALLPDGKTIITAGYDGWLLWHDVA